MHYLLISFSHHNTTLEIREKLALNDDTSLKSCLKKITEHHFVNESMIVSTCNRLEVLCSVQNVLEVTEYVFFVLGKHAGISNEELEGRADVFEDQGAMHHLFNVASSLDSMVVGETQIVGQLKDAHKFASENGFCDLKIARAMQFAFKCAAEVRNTSSISSKPVSIASVAVSKAKSQFQSIEDKTALIIGAGEMSRLCAKHLTSAGCTCVIMNRTLEKAEKIAQECGGKISVKEYKYLAESVNMYDFIFTATGATESIITSDMVDACSFERYWFDMAIPRDIDDSDISGLHIYRIDDLKDIVSENLALREEEAKLCYSIIGKYTQEFFHWLQALSIEPFIKAIYAKADKCAKEETARVIDKGFIPKEYEEQALKMNEQVLKRFLHDVTKRMREASNDLDADTLINAMQYICEHDENNEERS